MSLISPENHIGIAIVASMAVVSALAIVAVGLRLWARRLRHANLDASDYTYIVGLIFALALLGNTVNAVIQGVGLDADSVPLLNLMNALKGMLLADLLWTVANTCVRISFLLLYIRIFPRKHFVWFAWAFIAENVLFAIGVIIGSLLICQPLEYVWNQVTIEGHCGDQIAFQIWIGIHNLLSDVIVVVMPMPLVWNLQMPKQRKLAVSGVFAMGLGICIITLFRVIKTRQVDVTNLTKSYAFVGLLFELEPLLGIINCCLPLLNPVFDKVLGSSGNKPSTTAKYGSESAGLPIQTIGNTNSRFRRLDDDQYLLSTLPETNKCSGAYSSNTGQPRTPSNESFDGSKVGHGIMIDREWGIHTQSQEWA